MTNAATTVAAAPFVAALQPYLTALATAVVGGAVTLAARAFSKYTGVHIDAANVAAIQAAAETEAGRAVAAAADNLATAKIDVGSPVVVKAANAIAARLPTIMADAGITTDGVAHLVAGEIGRLQAQMSSVNPTSPKAA